jgi:hypothetical protein
MAQSHYFNIIVQKKTEKKFPQSICRVSFDENLLKIRPSLYFNERFKD